MVYRPKHTKYYLRLSTTIDNTCAEVKYAQKTVENLYLSQPLSMAAPRNNDHFRLVESKIWKIINSKLGLKENLTRVKFIGSLPTMVINSRNIYFVWIPYYICWWQIRNGTIDVAPFPVLYSNQWIKNNSISTASSCLRKFYFATALPEKLSKYSTLVEPYSSRMWIGTVGSIITAFFVLVQLSKPAIPTSTKLQWISQQVIMSIVHQHVNMDLEKEDLLFSALCLSGGVLIRVVLRHTHLFFKDPASRQILLALW